MGGYNLWADTISSEVQKFNMYYTQTSVLDEAKRNHPVSQWWLEADGCDLVEALGESVHHEWSGDEDLNDGVVAKQHSLYMQRLECINCLCRNLTITAERMRTANDLTLERVQLQKDIEFIVKSECNHLRASLCVCVQCMYMNIYVCTSECVCV